MPLSLFPSHIKNYVIFLIDRETGPLSRYYETTNLPGLFACMFTLLGENASKYVLFCSVLLFTSDCKWRLLPNVIVRLTLT
jgi:hypothetical protein